MIPIRDHNPSGRFPYVTWALIAANVVVFLLTWPGASDAEIWRIFDAFGMIPERISAGMGYETLVTSMFLHGGWMHLAGNMLFLYIFGDNIEDELGHFTFAAFYILSGLGAALLQFVAEPGSDIPMVGASGAIAGVMGAYLLMFPKARVDVLFIFIIFFRIFAIPAWIVLGLWFTMQIVGGWSMPADQGGVAYWAHAGGFLAGLALIARVWLRRGGPAFWARTHGTPPHPEATYSFSKSSIPKAGRRRRGD
jgi:membrane associated rhomboid family serine protease